MIVNFITYYNFFIIIKYVCSYFHTSDYVTMIIIIINFSINDLDFSNAFDFFIILKSYIINQYYYDFINVFNSFFN
jgi:hypothetical protein